MTFVECLMNYCATYSPSALRLLPYVCRTAVDTRVRSFGLKQRRARRNRHCVLAGLRNIHPVSQMYTSEEPLYRLLITVPPLLSLAQLPVDSIQSGATVGTSCLCQMISQGDCQLG